MPLGLRAALVSMVVAAALVVAVPAQADASERSDMPVAAASATKKALVVLNGLKVKAERSNGYDRDLFEHWVDADSDGCDAREEVLIAESQTQASTGPGCAVRGRWLSAYDGVLTTDASTFDIDHMVPLAEAWGSGAFKWSTKTRQAYANDLGYAGSLIAVSASSNRSKSDRDPAEWLPPAQSYWCTYATTWIAVKYRWDLTVDGPEKAALNRLVTDCGNPSMRLPSRAKVSTGGGGGDNGGGGGGGETGGGNDPRFPTCTAAIAAGYGPYYRGIDPEYDWYIDRDGDGVVCE
jgi:hypothetical protein